VEERIGPMIHKYVFTVTSADATLAKAFYQTVLAVVLLEGEI